MKKKYPTQVIYQKNCMVASLSLVVMQSIIKSYKLYFDIHASAYKGPQTDNRSSPI